MRKIIYLLVILSVLAVGCGKDNSVTNNQTDNIQDENTQGEENNDTSNENNDATNNDENSAGSNGDAIGPNGDAAQGEAPDENGDTSYEEENSFDLQIELPEGTIVGDYISSATVKGTDGWLLENPEYVTTRRYAKFQDRMTWAVTACGWIENIPYDGNFLSDGGPVISSEFCVEQTNGKTVKCGYFCEVSFAVFSDDAIWEHKVLTDFQEVDYWCIVYKKDASEFTWIFLNQEFFTEEQAMAVVESLPTTEEKIVVKTDFGYNIWVDYIEGYDIQYNKEYQQYRPLNLIKDGVDRTMALGYWSLDNIGKDYNALKEEEDFSEWGFYMQTGEFLAYISGDVGISIYEATDRVPVGEHVPEGARCYYVIWGHRKSSVIYTMVIDIGVTEDELRTIIEAIHFEFEEPEE